MKSLTSRALLAALVLMSVGGGFGPSALFAGEPPRIGLPPDEQKPLKVFQSVAADEGPDWGVKMLLAPEAWVKTKGRGVSVAVLDTGASLAHPDLKAAYAEAKDFTGSASGAVDKQGHGTHCAGSIGARGPLPGVAPECSIYAGKVLDDSGSGGVDQIAAGIRYAAHSWEADVISMSLGGSSPDNYIPAALKEADALGVIIICAAGNEGPADNTEGYPGHYPQSLSVAACDKNRQVTDFSSRGSNVFITGPGKDIRSTFLNGQYATMSGTSMATPHVAGLAALWVAAHPEVKKVDRPAAFRAALKASTKFTDRTNARGYGFPDAVKTVGQVGTPPVVTPPVGSLVTIGWNDLSAEKRGELARAGLTTFELKLGNTLGPIAPPVAPTAPPTPAAVGTGGHQVGEVLAGRYVWEFLPHSGEHGWVDRGPFVPATQCPGGILPPPANGVPAWLPPLHSGPGTLTGSPVTFPLFPQFGGGCPGGVCPVRRR